MEKIAAQKINQKNQKDEGPVGEPQLLARPGLQSSQPAPPNRPPQSLV
jgi:hypothetical protein